MRTNTLVLALALCAVALIGSAGCRKDESKPPESGRWTATGSLAVARGAFTITVLPSGKVLVAGGAINGSWVATATADLYDPSSPTWTTVAPMATPRIWACAALLSSGKVLVAGGNDGAGALASAEVYDPVSNTWSSTAGPMAAKRLAATCTRHAAGDVLVSGGSHTGGQEASAERYDPMTGFFTPTGSMATARSFHTETTLSTGEVLVVGGCIAEPCTTTMTASAERYDPASGSWASAGPLPSKFGVAGHTATLLPTGEVLVAGGCVNGASCPDNDDQRHVSLFDPVHTTWSDVGRTTRGRVLAAALLLSTGDVPIAAGDTMSPASAQRSTEC